MLALGSLWCVVVTLSAVWVIVEVVSDRKGIPGGWLGLAALVMTLPVSAVVFMQARPLGGEWSEVRKTRLVEASLEETLSDARRRCVGRDLIVLPGQPLAFPSHDGVVADCGPPLRLAFRFGGGLLDNWRGIVYDPSGAVALIPDASGVTIQALPHPLRALFGGDIVSCNAVGENLYACRFT